MPATATAAMPATAAMKASPSSAMKAAATLGNCSHAVKLSTDSGGGDEIISAARGATEKALVHAAISRRDEDSVLETTVIPHLTRGRQTPPASRIYRAPCASPGIARCRYVPIVRAKSASR